MSISDGLRGRVAVVTGGSRGIGRAISERLAADGATVVVASRKLAACESLAQDLTERFGMPSVGLACHVGRWEDCDRLVADVQERFGRLDIMINNAGMSPLYPSLDDVTEELFDKVVAVNLKGAFRLSVLAAEGMREGGAGAIVNISSIAAIRPAPGELPYAAAKAGLNAMTLGLARAYAPAVRVNAIMPGMIATDISQAWDADDVARIVDEDLPLGRLGLAEELAGLTHHLVSDDASYTTGTIVTVDGGLSL